MKSFGQTPSNDPHWQLVWQDDFNSLNTNIWYVANNFDHYGEPQVFTNRTDNVFISNGNLVLRLKSELYHCSDIQSWACNSEWYNYTSGWVESKQAYNTQYGFIEARIKLPYGNGLWPAFWTYIGSGVNGSNAAEIDIFEMLGGTLPSTEFTTNIHKNYPDDYFSKGLMSSYENTYHTYGIEWSPSRIIWYIDGFPVRLFANFGIVDPVRIILGMGIQRDENGNPLVNWEALPADMLIDYVKVYELNEDCNDFINTSNYDFSTYNNVEKNFIKIGDGSGSNSLSVGDNVTMRASQYIEINGDFYVPVGASLYLDANKDCSTDIGIECTQTFNPCTYNFAYYDNSVKKVIELGGNGCNVTITPTSANILLEATDSIVLKPGVTITPTQGKSVELKIVSCP